MASLAGFVCVVFTKIDYFSRGFLVTVLAIPEEVGVTSVVEGYISVFRREYHDIRSLDNRNMNHGNNKQGQDPFHDAGPFTGYHEFLH